MTVRQRVVLGWACMGAGFLVAVLLGSGLVEPPGAHGARTLQALMGAYAPWLGGALVAFLAGIALTRFGRR